MTRSKRIYVLDTNVLMHDPTALSRFEEHDVLLPMQVIEELDNGTNPPMMGTKSTPPPTPPSTATIPRKNVTTRRMAGQAHQGMVEGEAPAAAAAAGAPPAAWAMAGSPRRQPPGPAPG